MKKRFIIGFLICCLFGAAIVAVTMFHKQYEENLRIEEQQKQEAQAEQARRELAEKRQQAHQRLANNIRKLMQQDSETAYAVYVDFLDESDSIVINPVKMRASSMIKVFILSKAMEEVRDGRITPEQEMILEPSMKVGGAGSLNSRPDGSVVTVGELTKLMITESDNTATNMLIDLIGMDRINEYIQREGYTDTVLQRKMMDDAAIRVENDNFTSVKDVGTWFKKVYRHECVSKELDDQMIRLLLQQQSKECLPNALSDSHKIAHCTGELVSLYHDGGIVYTPAGNYIVCIMTEHQSLHSKAMRIMQQIAVQVDNAL